MGRMLTINCDDFVALFLAFVKQNINVMG